MENVNTIIQQLIVMFGNMETLIASVVSAITVAAIAYIKIKNILAGQELKEIIAPISSIAETNPAEVLRSTIAKPPQFDADISILSKTEIESNEGKAVIVASKAFEAVKAEKPNILKKLGINTAADMIPFVSLAYQNIVKPIIKKKG